MNKIAKIAMKTKNGHKKKLKKLSPDLMQKLHVDRIINL